MEPVARGTLKNALCFHTIKKHQISNRKIHVNPSWDEYKIFTYLLPHCWDVYLNVVKHVYKNGGYMHSFHFPVSTLTTVISASPFLFFFFPVLVQPYENHSGNASSAVITYPCTKHISRACNPLPPNLRVTFNNNLASCKNNTFVIVNFASCFQTPIIPPFKANVSVSWWGALLSRGLFFL